MSTQPATRLYTRVSSKNDLRNHKVARTHSGFLQHAEPPVRVAEHARDVRQDEPGERHVREEFSARSWRYELRLKL